jgi:cytochrome b561
VRLRNGEHGYGVVTKVLHWLTVAALLAQFVVGWSLDLDEGHDSHGDGSSHGHDDHEAASPFSDDGLSLGKVHIGLGLLVLVLALVRIVWRRTTPLPPWAEHLSARERRLEGRLEQVLLILLVVVPATGLLLVVAGDDDVLPVHVAGQIALLGVIAVHVGLVLKHTVVRRDRHLARML